MGHSIRGRLILVFIGMAIGPLLVIGVILAWLSYTSMQQQALTGVSAPAVNLVIVTLILAVVMAGIAGALGFLFARRIVEPIQALTEAAEAIGAGDLTARPQIPSDDEIGILAGTFNNLARQLRDRIGTLEHRVAEQTKALATFREISRLSAMLEEKQLVTEVVERVQKAFHYYHAQIYFYDETGENLILAGGTGEAGQKLLAEGHKIPKGKGPVGRAAESNTPFLLGDTSHDPGALPDPLLPKTRSEAAIPIAAGDQVLGVLDVQQNIVHGISPADVNLLQSIANQIALAVRKARVDTPDRHQAEREALIASINQKIRETTTAEDALQVAVRELGRALGSKQTRIELLASAQAGPVEAESKPGGGN
jgi:nitrate/nitrite-specific signal transduction histidine kinase